MVQWLVEWLEDWKEYDTEPKLEQPQCLAHFERVSTVTVIKMADKDPLIKSHSHKQVCIKREQFPKH